MSQTLTINTRDLRRILELCTPVIDVDTEHKYQGILGIQFEWDKDRKTLTAISTDARQLITVEADARLLMGDPYPFILNAQKLFAKRSKLQTSKSGGDVVIALTGEEAAVAWNDAKGNDVRVVLPINDGKFPNWKAIMPSKPSDGCLKVDADVWTEAWHNSARYDGIQLGSTDVKRDDVSQAKIEFPEIQPRYLPVDESDGTYSLIVNFELLMEHLALLKRNKVQIDFFGRTNPIRVTCNDMRSTYILQPMVEIEVQNERNAESTD